MPARHCHASLSQHCASSMGHEKKKVSHSHRKPRAVVPRNHRSTGLLACVCMSLSARGQSNASPAGLGHSARNTRIAIRSAEGLADLHLDLPTYARSSFPRRPQLGGAAALLCLPSHSGTRKLSRWICAVPCRVLSALQRAMLFVPFPYMLVEMERDSSLALRCKSCQCHHWTLELLQE